MNASLILECLAGGLIGAFIKTAGDEDLLCGDFNSASLICRAFSNQALLGKMQCPNFGISKLSLFSLNLLFVYEIRDSLCDFSLV